jgi:hypothetical protein
MESFQLRINGSFIVLLLIILSNGCGDKIEGTFYLSEKSLKYQVDTTILTFQMIDEYGIVEEFSLVDPYSMGHNYFNEWGVDGEAFGEVYYVEYHSVLNDYFFTYYLRADEKFTELDIEWNQQDQCRFNIANGAFEGGVRAEVSFYDSLKVGNIVYRDIIEIDFSQKKNKINEQTPVKTFLSGKTGLVKFVRKDGVVVERID